MGTKRKDLSLSEKLKVIELLNINKSQSEIAKAFGISQSQVSRIKSNSENVLQQYRENGNLNRKRKRDSKHAHVDKAMLEWFREERMKGVYVNGPLIMEKAEELAKSCSENTNFNASKGWLYRWQQRNNLAFKKAHRESTSVQTLNVSNCFDEIAPILNNYNAENIFTCDETALYFHALPMRVLAKKKEEMPGLKQNQDRVTLLFCVNQTGTVKLPPLMIGKTKNPKCLRNIKKFPVPYKAAKNAWMTAEIFVDWLQGLDDEMQRMNRKILLLIDSVPSHKIANNVSLSNINIQFLPSNSANESQPFDQGIITSFKANYRRLILKEISHLLDDTELQNSGLFEVYKKINIITAMHLVKKAWQNVPGKVIVNCFRSTKLESCKKASNVHEDSSVNEKVIYDFEEYESSNIPLQLSVEEFSDFINCDEDLPTERNLIDNKMATICYKNSDSEPESEEDDSDVSLTPNVSEVKESLDVIRRYFEAHGGNYDILYSLEKEVDKCRAKSFAKQTAVEDSS